MAKHLLYNASVVLNSVDFSDHVETVEFTVTLNNAGSAATMGDIEDYSMAGTRKVSPITLTMFQDFAASEVYATLSALWTNRTSFNAVIKADAGATATTNPAFTISCFISSFPIVSGTRGDRHMSQVVLEPAAAMTIATS